jgi:neopullulanase
MMSPKTPDWVKRAVFYQIFPDRFAPDQRVRLPQGLRFKPWGSSPDVQGYQGGNLYGIADKLPYLTELGVTAIYLNPIFSSASNHRYHAYDYMQVDPLLGGNDALRFLLDEAHRRNIRIVLDGVFNHTGRGFWAFHHILENGGNSPYIDWFKIHDWPLRPYPEDGRPINYDAWWGIPALPKLNIANPDVRQYVLDVARYWIEFGADGWRLDVPEEINDPSFWRDFRRIVKAANPEAYIVGEIWHEAPEWLAGDRFDAVMNYVLSRAAYGFFGSETLRMDERPGGFTLYPLGTQQFADTIDHMLRLYQWEITQAQLNVMDTHDTPRMLHTLQGDQSAMRLCVLFQMTMPGAPCIYYGDEVGMTGGMDPGSRGAFPWHDEGQWNNALLAFYKKAIALRRQNIVLSVGDFRRLYAEQGIYAFRRVWGRQSAIVILNASKAAFTLPKLEVGADLDHHAFCSIWNNDKQGDKHIVANGALVNLTIPPRDALVLIRQHH